MTKACAPIVLFCDFGLPYTGQMKAKLVQGAPNHTIIDLFHDVPAHDVRAGSVLLAAHAADFPVGCVFVCVVDPGVGSDQRKPGVVFAGGRWFVGPLNGLFEHVLRRWPIDAKAYEVTWSPEYLSASFHGRDLFAPVAAFIARGDLSGLAPVAIDDVCRSDFPDDVLEIVYVDSFGNLMTGLRWDSLAADETIEVAGRVLPRLRTFSDAESGQLFVYENAVGLTEIAANQGNARNKLEIGPGTRIKVIKV
ncbi:S-adenosyl-l-methionine hydroxide adenosyltransferase family protein [Pseudomonadota bacterium]